MFHSVQILQDTTDSPGYSSATSTFRVSKFPGPLRGSAEGPQTPDSMFPSVQIPGNSSENSTFRVSEFPRHLRCGSAEGPQIPVSKFPSVQIPLSRILLCKKFHIPSFRVSEAEGPLLGPSRRDPQIPDSEFPSLRRPLLGPSRMDRPKSQNPNCKYSPDSELFRERNTYVGSRFQNTERSFYFRSCSQVQPILCPGVWDKWGVLG